MSSSLDGTNPPSLEALVSGAEDAVAATAAVDDAKAAKAADGFANNVAAKAAKAAEASAGWFGGPGAATQQAAAAAKKKKKKKTSASNVPLKGIEALKGDDLSDDDEDDADGDADEEKDPDDDMHGGDALAAAAYRHAEVASGAAAAGAPGVAATAYVGRVRLGISLEPAAAASPAATVPALGAPAAPPAGRTRKQTKALQESATPGRNEHAFEKEGVPPIAAKVLVFACDTHEHSRVVVFRSLLVLHGLCITPRPRLTPV